MNKTDPHRIFPEFKQEDLLRLQLTGQHTELCNRLLLILRYFRDHTLINAEASHLGYFDELAKTLLYIFAKPTFAIPPELASEFIKLNQTIANLVALSTVGTTDSCLRELRQQPGSLPKMLALFNARCTERPDRKAFFDTDPDLASIWYSAYGAIHYSALATAIGCENLEAHYNFDHPNLRPLWNLQELYFGATYLDGYCDRFVKRVVNRAVAERVRPYQPALGKPDAHKVAVVSGFWTSFHSVYRTLHGYIRALKPDYHLTFYQLGDNTPPDDGTFDRIIKLSPAKLMEGLAVFAGAEYAAMVYPDIGMTPDSVSLANLRLAPIQMMGTGHPVSTFGSKIDYFVSGADVDNYDHPETNYSERLVLLPGMGAIHNRPLYNRHNRGKQTYDLIINCSWFAQKINHPLLQVVQRLIAGLKRPAKFRFYLGNSTNRCNDHLVLVVELLRMLGPKNIEVYTGLGYQEYMARMEEGDLTIESYPFGGSNTLSDSLYLGIPTIAWQSNRWYGRIGSAMLRAVGLEDCIATSADDYLAKIWHLCHDDAAREQVRTRLAKVDLNKTIYATADAAYFKKMMDYLIANHQAIQQSAERTPIIIPRDSR